MTELLSVRMRILNLDVSVGLRAEHFVQAEEACHANLANEYTEHPRAAALAWVQLGACARALPEISATVLAHDTGRVSCACRYQLAHAHDPAVYSLDCGSRHRRQGHQS